MSGKHSVAFCVPDIKPLFSCFPQMFEPAVTDVVSKTGKKSFDAVQIPKVIAFIQKDSPGNFPRMFQVIRPILFEISMSAGY